MTAEQFRENRRRVPLIYKALTKLFVKIYNSKYKQHVLRQKKQMIYMWKTTYCKK